MALPIIAAIARIGIGAAIKKFGKGAVKKAVNAKKKDKPRGATRNPPKKVETAAKKDKPRGATRNPPEKTKITTGSKPRGATRNATKKIEAATKPRGATRNATKKIEAATETKSPSRIGKALESVKQLERGVSSRAGSKKGLEAIKGTTTRNRGKGYGLRQKGSGKMATAEQRAANVRSGRRRIGVGATAASLIPMGGEDAAKKTVTPKVTPKGAKPKATVTPSTTAKPFNMTAPQNLKPRTTPSTTKKPSAPSNNMQSPYSGKKLPPKSDSSKYAKPKSAPSKGDSWKQYKTIAAAKAANSPFYSKGGKKMAAAFKEDLGKGESLRDYMNKKLGKTRKMMAGGGVKKMNMGGMATPNAAGMDSAAMMAMKKKKRKPMMPAQRAMAGGASVPMMKKGGKVRGAGIAKKGVRACKMR